MVEAIAPDATAEMLAATVERAPTTARPASRPVPLDGLTNVAHELGGLLRPAVTLEFPDV
jgi:hypothetical protein